MPTPSGKSILECPCCGKRLINIASKVERVHPVAKWINNNFYRTIVIWGALAPVALFVLHDVGFTSGRGIGFGWIGLLLLPAMAMYFLVRMFPLYRVTDCPYCGYHEELLLGYSAIG